MNKKLLAVSILASASLILTGCKAENSGVVDETKTTTETTVNENGSVDNGTNMEGQGNSNGSTTETVNWAKNATEASTAFERIISKTITAADKATSGKAPTVDQYLEQMRKVTTDVSFKELTGTEKNGVVTFTGTSDKIKCSQDVSFTGGKSVAKAPSCK